MPKFVFPESGPGSIARSGTGIKNQAAMGSVMIRLAARSLAGLLVCTALLGGWPAISASQQQGSPVEPAAVDTPHEPLTGKACIDCHEQAVPSKGLCLLTGEQMCVLCHEIPAAGGPAGLLDPSAPLCFKCHAEDAFRGGFAHGPFAAGACLTCHSPHGGDDSAMVRISSRQLCLSCHKDMGASLAGARFLHRADASGCTGCHSPHASEQRYLVKENVPGVCEKCHENIFSDLETALVRHSPVTEEPACMNCHNPHMAENERLLPDDDMGTCLKCHNEPIKVDQHELTLMGQMLDANPMHHGPIQNRECSGCHNPHSSPYFRLLTDAYPQRRYAPFFESNYALCFRCHESTLVKEERTETLTGFRDGDRNLHFVHVDKSSMGRTCRLCHETHASSLPKYMRVSVPFGTWDLPIKFKETENGGSCEPGCHAAKNYDRQAAQSGRP